jgi:hypothetical protein
MLTWTFQHFVATNVSYTALYLGGYSTAENGILRNWDRSEYVRAPTHEIHSSCGERKLEFLLEESDDSHWLFRRSPAIQPPLSMIGAWGCRGVPYLALEIVLLYKAKHGCVEPSNKSTPVTLGK